MKAIRYLALLVLFIIAVGLMVGCSNSSDYDKGYSDGYNGKEKGLFYSFASQDYKSGYEDGAYHANVVTVYENYNRDLDATARYLGISVYDLKKLLKGYGYSIE